MGWLEDLTVGDQVALKSTGWRNSYTIQTIIEATKTTLSLTTGEIINRSTGRYMGVRPSSSDFRMHVVPVTDEILYDIDRRRAIDAFEQAKDNKFTVVEYDKITAFMYKLLAQRKAK